MAVGAALMLASVAALSTGRSEHAVASRAQPDQRTPSSTTQQTQAQPQDSRRPQELSGIRDLIRSGQNLGLDQPTATADTVARSAAGAQQSTAQAAAQGINVRLNRDRSNFPQNEASVAINPTNAFNVVAGGNDYRIGIGQSGFYTLAGGGQVVPNPLDPPDPDGLIPMVNTGFGEAWDAGGDPAVAFNATGRAFYAGLFFNRLDCRNGVTVSRSDNGGLTWTRSSLLNGDGIVVYHSSATDCSIAHDKEYIAVDRFSSAKNGYVYVTWTRFRFACGSGGTGYCESPIYFSQSTDGGVSWSAAIEISGSSPALCSFGNFFDPSQGASDCNFDQFSVPSVGGDGTVYVSFINGNTPAGNPNSQMLMVKCPATNNCASPAGWSAPVKIAEVIDSNYPINVDGRLTLSNSQFRLGQETFNIAIDRSVTPNRLYATWMDNRNGGDNPTGNGATGGTDTDIFVSISTDGGTTWGPPVKVNQDTSRNDQWWPWAAVASGVGPAGRSPICINYMDRRADPGNKLNEVWASCSLDGGVTWRDQELTDTDPQNCVDFGGFPVPSGPNAGKSRFIGDYNNIDAVVIGGVPYFFAAWVDCRNGTAAIRQSDIYGTRVNPAAGR
jgi:hypothetical protein